MSRDITYCAAAMCPNTACYRHIANLNWASNEIALYSFSDFSKDCDYVQKKEKTDGQA